MPIALSDPKIRMIGQRYFGDGKSVKDTRRVNRMMTFLDEVKALFEEGEREDALELLDLQLEADPDDAGAHLLMAELCLEAGQNPAFVGQAANDYRALKEAERSSREREVVDGALAWAGRELADARKELAGDYTGDALQALNRAVELAPWDSSILLAKGLTLLDYLTDPAQEKDEDHEQDEDVGSLAFLLSFESRRRRRGSVEPERLIEEIESSLSRARELSPSDQPAWREATLKLADLLAGTGRYREAADLLREIPADPKAGSDRLTQLDQLAARDALDRTLNWARQLMRQGRLDEAAPLLEGGLLAAPAYLPAWLALAEWFLLKGDHERVEAVCRWVTDRENTSPEVDYEAVEPVAASTREAALSCNRCGKSMALDATKCGTCQEIIPTDVLLADRYRLNGHSKDTQTVASVGLIESLHAQNRKEEALRHLTRLLPHLPARQPVTEQLQEMHAEMEVEWAAQAYEESLSTSISAFEAGDVKTAQTTLAGLADAPQADGRALAWLVVVMVLTEPLEADARPYVRRAVGVPGETWTGVPLKHRRKLARALLNADLLVEVNDLFPKLFTTAERDTVRVMQLLKRRDVAVQARCDDLAARARQALDDGRPDEALALTGQALALQPGHVDATLAHAQAELATGSPYSAGRGFRAVMVMDTAAEMATPVAVEAGLGLARTLEELGDLPGALAVLDDLPRSDPAVVSARADLARQQAGLPAVHVAKLDSAITTDTLRRVPANSPLHQGVFAIAIRAAARHQGNDPLSPSWDRMVRAGRDFVAALGGLVDTLGEPTFELRLVARPDPEVPARGVLSVALLCKVTHPDDDGAAQLALGLWHKLRPLLPLAEHAIYEYQPVHRDAELQALLDPFPSATVAEIVRREATRGGTYVVQPFTPGGTTLQNLAWTLLRQPGPSLASIHLAPARLLPWESAAMQESQEQLRAVKAPRVMAEGSQNGSGVDGAMHTLLVSGEQDTTAARLVAETREALSERAFVLRVSTASSEPNDAMLSHRVGAELFGPDGSFEVVHAITEDEISSARRNLSALDAERWTHTHAPANLARLRHLVSGIEAALAFRLPLPDVEGIPGLPTIDVKAVPPTIVPTEGVAMGESVTTVAGQPLVIRTRQIDRRRHLYVVGKTGVGKSTLLEGIALQDIETGRGVAFFDPHGDTVDALLARIPPERVDDVIVFDPSDRERPIGLNFLQAETDSQRHRIVTEFIQMLMRMYDPDQRGIVGPRFQHNVRNAMLTAMLADPEATLIEVVRALTDSKYVRAVLPKVNDLLVRNYWEKQIANTSDFHKSEVLDYIVSKFNRFVGDELMRNIIGQSRSTLDFRQIMDERKILLINLSKGKIGPESAEFLGFLLLQSLLIASLSRADSNQESRQDYCVYVDEFQTFATESFAAMLSEGRKYGLCLVMANQYMRQLPPELQQAVLGNVGSLVAFRMGTADAHLLAQEFYPVFAADDLISLPRYTTAVRLLVDGVAARPFAMRTRLVKRLPDAQLAARIRALSRQRYGRDVKAVEREVAARFKIVA